MKKNIRIFWYSFFALTGFVVLFFLLVMLGVFGRLPSTKKLENPTILQSSEVYAADGTLMGKYYLERGNRSNVNYKDISPHVIDALIATEDERFHDHAGIDFKRTISAIVSLGSRGGGSTISQQLAKTLLDQGSKNKIKRLIEKFKEYIVAIRLERNFTKEEIIALYLNAVPYGDNVYGIRNASRTFFQKEPDRLTVDEAAVLVGMLKGNTIYNPRINPIPAKQRRDVVLGQMEKNGYLSTAEVASLKQKPIPLNYKKLDENTGYAPYFREMLRDEVRQLLKNMKKADGEPYDIYEDGLKIYTTIIPKMQEYAEEAVAQQMPMLQKSLNAQRNVRTGSVWKDHQNVLDAAMKASDRWRNMKELELSDEEIRKSFSVPVKMKVFAWNPRREKDTTMTPLDSIKYHRQMIQTGFMVMDPHTGEVKAWVGGINYKTYKYDHVNLKTKRQVGSSIKPFLYCQAMEERGYTPNTPVQDVQQSFGRNQLVPATSRSCTGRTMSMASALAWSKNCATAYIMKDVGPAQFSNFLEKINIPTRVDPYPSIALGSCDLSLYEMLWGYTIFPGRGFSTKPVFISRIEDRNGNVIKRADFTASHKEAVSEVTSYRMVKMMEGTVTAGTAGGLMQRLGAKEMGGKTGTTNDNADAWFIGFTPQLLAGVWIGCDDRFIRIESAQGYGGTAARPIWESFFKKVYANKSLGILKDAEFPKPADLQNEAISADMIDIMDAGEDYYDNNTTPGDYLDDSYEYMRPESRPPVDDDQPARQPKKEPANRDTSRSPKIGDMKPQEDKKEKRGILRKIFGREE